jgi:hypothetical protein
MITGTETAHLTPRAATIIPDARLPVVEAKVAADLNLRDGQVIQATLQVNLQALRLNAWDLRLPLTAAQAEILARWAMPNPESFQLRVQVLPNGNILLRPLAQTATTPNNAPAPATPDALATQANRAQQLSMRPPDLRAWLALLRPQVLETMLGHAVPLGSPSSQQLLNALRQRPSSNQISAEQLKNWVKLSGLQAEHALAHAKPVSPADFKLGLRALLSELSSDDLATLHHVQQAVDDIEASQLMAGQNLPGKEWTLSLVIPFRDANPVLIRFSRGSHQDEHTPPPMTVQLHTQTAGMRDVWMQTKILKAREVDLVMWTTDEALAQEARAQAPRLAQDLEDLGLSMIGLQVIHGPKPDQEPTVANHLATERGHLLDVRT